MLAPYRSVILKYIVSRGEDIQAFDDRREAVTHARELSLTGKVTVEWKTPTTLETLQYANGELQSADSESLSRR